MFVVSSLFSLAGLILTNISCWRWGYIGCFVGRLCIDKQVFGKQSREELRARTLGNSHRRQPSRNRLPDTVLSTEDGNRAYNFTISSWQLHIFGFRDYVRQYMFIVLRSNILWWFFMQYFYINTDLEYCQYCAITKP